MQGSRAATAYYLDLFVQQHPTLPYPVAWAWVFWPQARNISVVQRTFNRPNPTRMKA